MEDQFQEGDETVELILTNFTGDVLPGQINANLLIVDNDFAAGQLNFASSLFTTNEDAGIILANIFVVRTNGSSGIVSIDYSTRDGTAVAGLDYLSTNGTLAFAEGETVKFFQVPVLPDLFSETNETVNLELSNSRGGATPGFQNSAILSIENNDILTHGNFIFTNALPETNGLYTVSESAGSITIDIARIWGTTNVQVTNIVNGDPVISRIISTVDVFGTTNGTASSNDFQLLTLTNLQWGIWMEIVR